jgi:general nucleoside transport system permease protein
MIELLNTSLQAGTPILLAALGGMFAHRAGVLHLGLEGLMLLGAFVTVATAAKTGSVLTGLVLAIVVDVLVSVVFWVLITYLDANVMITGLALSMSGVGITSYLLEATFGTQGAIQAPRGLPTPVSGAHGVLRVFDNLSVLTWAAVILTAISWFLLRRTRFGLRLAAVGEDPFSARGAGVKNDRMRLLALMIGGALCALAGAELALSSVQSFAENMTQGRGFLAFTAVLLGMRHPIGTAAAALFFGLAEGLGIQSQLGLDHVLPAQFVLMIPYVCTIVAVTVSSVLANRRGVGPPSVVEKRL